MPKAVRKSKANREMNFMRWMLLKRDVPGLVVGLLISNATSATLLALTSKVLSPTLIYIAPWLDHEVELRDGLKLQPGAVVMQVIVLAMNLLMGFFIMRMVMPVTQNMKKA